MSHAAHIRRLLLSAGSCLLVAAGTNAALAQPGIGPIHPRKDAFKHQVEKLEDVWRTAQLNGDVASMDKLLSDDYVGISMNGQVVTKAQQLDRLRNRQTILTKIDLDDVKVKLIGTTAIVTSRAEVEGTNDGASVRGMYRYTRVYSRLPTGDWKITNFEATRVGPPPGGSGPGALPDRHPQPSGAMPGPPKGGSNWASSAPQH
jgi:ketosteroid isomerase-like protein